MTPFRRLLSLQVPRVLAGCLALLAGAVFLGGGVGGPATAPAAAPPDQDSLYRDWGAGLVLSDYEPVPTAEQLAAAVKAGFKTLKISANWGRHTAAAAPYAVDANYLKSKLELAAQAQAAHLRVIVLLAPDSALGKDPGQQEERYVAMCGQVAEACREQPGTVAFELLCEPGGKLDAERWNHLLSRVLPDIRKSQPTRLVLVGASKFYTHLMKLTLPEDDRYLVVAYYYWLVGKDAWEGTAAQKTAIGEQFGKLADWAHAHKHPLYLSAFGKNIGAGDLESHPRWMSCVARAAEERHIPWAYARFFGGDFAPFDVKAGRPPTRVLQALMPTSQPAATTSPATTTAPAR